MIKRTTIFAFALLFAVGSSAQNTVDLEEFKRELRTITTAVPFLLIAPDSRSGAMGDAGVSLSADANALHWNPSKIAFAPNQMEMSLGYSPWLKNLVPDINMAYLSGYYRLDKQAAVGLSLRYFSLGDITFTDIGGNTIGQFKPNEFAVDGTYARKFTDRFSMGISLRYVYSNLTNGIAVGGVESKPGTSVATDISMFYTNSDIKLGSKDGVFAFGINISNIGSKMSYSSTSERDFLPINLRLGPTLTIEIDEFQEFTITTDINKLLVPSQPAYGRIDPNQIVSGMNPDVGVAAGMFQSFYDAPGLVVFDDDDNFVGVEKGTRFTEEMREINIGAGMEYWYDGQFAIRAGYFHEHYTKGNRRFFTVGAGLRFKKFALDFSYLIPTQQQHPLANTLRFTLGFNFDDSGDDDSAGEGI